MFLGARALFYAKLLNFWAKSSKNVRKIEKSPKRGFLVFFERSLAVKLVNALPLERPTARQTMADIVLNNCILAVVSVKAIIIFNVPIVADGAFPWCIHFLPPFRAWGAASR